MSINSLDFFSFFLITFAFYYISQRSKRLQNWILLLSSLAFYFSVDWEMGVILCGCTLVAYWAGLYISSRELGSKERKYGMFFSVSIFVCLLAYFKYCNFFVNSCLDFLNSLGFHTERTSLSIIVPLGISFFTFKIISYILEVYWGKVERCSSFLSFANYITFFPTIASGPIDRPYTFLPQLEKPRLFNYSLAVDGTGQILWGLFKKMVVADNLALVVNEYWAGYEQESGIALFWVACLYSIQIYADFSGYSDMSIGVGKLLGFNICRNFRNPYFARNMSEFWRKWHISLTSWLTDYIYKPLGGSRCSQKRHLMNLMIVFLVSGLWHGADWSFVFWGGYHGLLLVILVLIGTKKYKDAILGIVPSFYEAMCMLSVFICSTIGWIFFRADNMTSAWGYIQAMCMNTWLVKPDLYVKYWFFIGLMFGMEWLTRNDDHPLIGNYPRCVKWILYVILSYSIVYHQGVSADFIYFQF